MIAFMAAFLRQIWSENAMKKMFLPCVLLVAILGMSSCSKKKSDAASKEGGITLKEAQKKGPVKPDPNMRKKMREKTRRQGGGTR